MSATNRQELWRQYIEAGFVSGEIPAAGEVRSPWPVRVMLGVAGWIGAIFLLGFAGAVYAAIFRSAQAAIPAGILCCAAAFAVFKGLPHNEFLEQFAFAVSLAGQSMLMVGWFQLVGAQRGGSAVPFLLMAVVEFALAFAVPNYLHRVFTAVAANVCLFIAAVILGAAGVATGVAAVCTVLLWIDPVRLARRPSLWEPIAYGFAIALLHMDGSLLLGSDLWRVFTPYGAKALAHTAWFGPAAEGLVFIYAAWVLRARARVRHDSAAGIAIIAASLLTACFGIAAPGIVAAILVMVLAFSNSNRVLMGLGLIAFAGYLSHFYYQLHFTLLVKSGLLFAAGVVLLLMRFALGKFFPAGESQDA